MFALERYPDFVGNLDDVLHVVSASDAAPDSFEAHENYLSQLEIKSKNFRKDEDDFMAALDECLLKIYKGDPADLQPLLGRLDPPAVTEELIPTLSEDVDLQTVDVDVVSTPVACSEESNFDLVTTSDENLKKVVIPVKRKRGRPRNSEKRVPAVTKKKKALQSNKTATKPANRLKKKSKALSKSASLPVGCCSKKSTSNANTKKMQVKTKVTECAIAPNRGPLSTLTSKSTIAVGDSSTLTQCASSSLKESVQGIAAADSESLLELFEESSLQSQEVSATGEENSATSWIAARKPRGTILIEPLHKQKRQRGDNEQKRKEEKSCINTKIMSLERHLVDHNYWHRNPISPKTLAGDCEKVPAVPPSAKAIHPSKIVKWQDYLQRVRLGVRSAPNSPTTSPKIPRGAARKVNNFMVMEGGKAGTKLIAVPQSQTPKPPSPLLDPLTAVKTQTKPKSAVKLQEFEEYLAQLESLRQGKTSESDSLSTTSESSSVSTVTVATVTVSTKQQDLEQLASNACLPYEHSDKDTDYRKITAELLAKSATTDSSTVKPRTSPSEPKSNVTADPRRSAKSRQKITVLKPISSGKWHSETNPHNSKRNHNSAKSTHKPASSSEANGSKAVVLNNVTGKLEEILSSTLTRQQKAPTPADPVAAAQQQETLQKLIEAISSLQTKQNATIRLSNHANTHLSNTESSTVKAVKKQPVAVPSPLSLIHEIKQNMSKKNEESIPVQCLPAQLSKRRKSSADLSNENLPSASHQERSCQSKPNQSALESQSHKDMKLLDTSEQEKPAVPLPPSSLDDDETVESSVPPIALSPHVTSSETDSTIPQSPTNQAPEVIHQIPVLITQKSDPIIPLEDEYFGNQPTFNETLDTTLCTMQATEEKASIEIQLNDTHDKVEISYSKSDEVEIQKSNDAIDCNVQEREMTKSEHENTLEDGEITDSNVENESQDTEKSSSLHELASKGNTDNVDVTNDVVVIEPESEDIVSEIKATLSAEKQIHAKAAHQHGLFGVQQKRGLKFSSEVQSSHDHEIEPLERSVSVSSVNNDSDSSHKERYRKKHYRKKRKKSKRKHKKHKKKRHRHSRRSRDRRTYEDESDSSSYGRDSRRNRKRRMSHDSYSSSRDNSSDFDRDGSPRPKLRRYSREWSRRSRSSMSRSRSRTPKRSWEYEHSERRYERSFRRNTRGSLSPASSVERSDRYRNRSPEPKWDYISRRRINNRELKDQAIRERRVMYVGQINNSTTKYMLRQRFKKFGKIDDVELYFRRIKDSYAFVTFNLTKDAYAAIENGNEGEEVKYDLCFGGRRQFCQTEYADLDDEGKVWAEEEQEEDFDTLLRKAMKR